MEVVDFFDEPKVVRLVLNRGYGPMGTFRKMPCSCGREAICALAEEGKPYRPMCINCVILMIKTGGREIQVKE